MKTPLFSRCSAYSFPLGIPVRFGRPSAEETWHCCGQGSPRSPPVPASPMSRRRSKIPLKNGFLGPVQSVAFVVQIEYHMSTAADPGNPAGPPARKTVLPKWAYITLTVFSLASALYYSTLYPDQKPKLCKYRGRGQSGARRKTFT